MAFEDVEAIWREVVETVTPSVETVTPAVETVTRVVEAGSAELVKCEVFLSVLGAVEVVVCGGRVTGTSVIPIWDWCRTSPEALINWYLS